MSARSREERWLHLGMAVIVTLTVVLLTATIWGLSVALDDHAADAARSDVQLAELEAVAARLDAQADDIKRQVEVAEQQAAVAAVQAEESARIRAQFRSALSLLLDALEVDVSPFESSPHVHAATAPAPEPAETPAPATPDAPGRSGNSRKDK